MNFKKITTLLLALILVIGIAGCGQTANEGEKPKEEGQTATQTPQSSGEAIRLINGKIEIDQPLKDLATQYEAKTGQKVIIESLGGGVDIQATVKGYYQAGNMPDIFVIGGSGDYVNWEGMTADLSDTAFAKDTNLAFKENDKVVGFPYAVEGYGITYNADILKKAGIDPKSLTSFSAYKAAFEKIDSMKEELGLAAVVSVAAEAGQMYWSTANHLFGYYLSGGKDRADKTLLNNFLKGEIDKDRAKQFGKFFKLLADYSDKQVLLSGTYDDQLALWAQGKAAFITQGNWIDASLGTYNVTFDCGIAPLAFTEEEMTGVLADCPSWWVVYDKSPKVKEAKDFLDWLATSPEGQDGFVNKCGMVSPYNSCTLKPQFPLAKTLSSYIEAGNTYAWDWVNMPEGIAMQYTGYVFESYAKDELDLDGFVEMLSAQTQKAVTEKK